MRKTKYLNSNMNNSNFNSETQKCNKTCQSTHLQSSKLWSSQLWTQFKQLRIEVWKSQDFNVVWTRDLREVTGSNPCLLYTSDAADE